MQITNKYLVKSTLLDIPKEVFNNRDMSEVVKPNIVEEIIEDWKLGVKFDEEGYEDQGFTLQLTALNRACQLSTAERQEIANRLFPIK